MNIRKVKIKGTIKWRKNNLDYFIAKAINDGDKELAKYLIKYKENRKLDRKDEC